MMRAGFVAVPGNIKFPRETIGFILKDAQVKLAFCDATSRPLLPADVPTVDFDARGSDGFADFLDPGPFETVRPQPGEVGNGALYFRLDRPSEGRALIA